MTETPLLARVRAAHRRAVIVVGSMVASLFVYTVIVEVLSRSAGILVMVHPQEIVRWVFYAVALSMVFACNVVRALMMRGIRPAPDGSADEAIARLTAAHIVTGALAEVPAVLGLVLYVIARQPTDFYILAVVSLYLLLRHFPRLGHWMARVDPAWRREDEDILE